MASWCYVESPAKEVKSSERGLLICSVSRSIVASAAVTTSRRLSYAAKTPTFRRTASRCAGARDQDSHVYCWGRGR